MDRDQVARLETIGFVRDEDARLGLRLPDGEVVGAASEDRLQHMSGRLANVDLMAAAIDALDGVSDPSTRKGPGGERQFLHLVDRVPDLALCYLALRRLQRTGDVAGLRRGLVALLAHDFGELTGEDAVAMLWRPEWGHPALPDAGDGDREARVVVWDLPLYDETGPDGDPWEERERALAERPEEFEGIHKVEYLPPPGGGGRSASVLLVL